MLKGVILAGGLGTRLYPSTKNTSKHLLPVGDEPMICHSIKQLTSSGINDILIVTNPLHVEDFKDVLGDGEQFGCQIDYQVQNEAKGIAHALSLAEDFAEKHNIVVLLGDNIFETTIRTHIEDYLKQRNGARVVLKQVKDPERYGVANIVDDKITLIEEKPPNPHSDYAVIGLYFYDSTVFDIIRTIKPSSRGEFEITTVNNVYVRREELEYSILQGEWVDAGTHESLAIANKMLLSRKE
ncbi:NTP transferase domain-containing protein [Candidatus Poribacteria bacterium]|nr:NTP transferase domain-containing protein [Candidatus Poribacteria bacterium]